MGPALLTPKENSYPLFTPKENAPIANIIYKIASVIAVLNLYIGAISDPTSTKIIATTNGKTAYSISL